MIDSDDRANFIALLKAHEELTDLIKTTSETYFREALELGASNLARTELIGDALDDLHLPLEANIKRLRTFLDHAEDSRKGCTAPEAVC